MKSKYNDPNFIKWTKIPGFNPADYDDYDLSAMHQSYLKAKARADAEAKSKIKCKPKSKPRAAPRHPSLKPGAVKLTRDITPSEQSKFHTGKPL